MLLDWMDARTHNQSPSGSQATQSYHKLSTSNTELSKKKNYNRCNLRSSCDT